MKIGRKIIIILLFSWFASLLNGQTNNSSHFVKKIYLILKDSATSQKHTVYRDITYNIHKDWMFNKSTQMRDLQTITDDKVVLHLSPDEIMNIDSIYFEEKYTVDLLGVGFYGSDVDIWTTNNNYLDVNDRDLLKKFSSKSGVFYLEINVVNAKEEKQHLIAVLKQ